MPPVPPVVVPPVPPVVVPPVPPVVVPLGALGGATAGATYSALKGSLPRCSVLTAGMMTTVLGFFGATFFDSARATWCGMGATAVGSLPPPPPPPSRR